MDESNDRVRRQFGPNADRYATSSVHAQGASLARLVELTAPRADWSVLDVATGAGHTALTFAPHVARVVATDVTPQMLDTAQRLAKERGLANIEFKPADAQSLPFDDSTFDLVTSRIALHHYSDAPRGIQEMARVCKVGGLVALADNIVPPDKQAAGYINHFEKMRDPSHQWAYPAVRLEKYFADAGLHVEHQETFSKEMEFEPWIERANASAETRAKLLKWLSDAPGEIHEFLSPRTEGGKTFFLLHEVILIGRKG